VADVVDARDDHAAVSLLEQRDGRVLDLERKETSARSADHAMQCDLDDAAMSHHEDVAMGVVEEDLVDRATDSRVKPLRTLTTRHQVPIRLFDPTCPCLRVTRGNLRGAQAFPLAQEDLAQRGLGCRLNTNRRADDRGRLEGSVQVARVVRDDGAAREPGRQPLGLAATVGRKRRVELALDAMFAIPGRLAVADEEKARRSGTRG
jgi:hypothetical protein